MRTPMSEILDLTLTQALERYMEMESEAAYDAIVKEWPEQIAVMLVEFFFKSTCGNCAGIPEFIQVPREQGDTNFLVPICSCEWR
jgi:hypothetical protein